MSQLFANHATEATSKEFSITCRGLSHNKITFQLSMFGDVPCGSFCSHAMVYPLWIAANQFPNNFIAVKCDTVQDARDRNCFKGPLITNFLGPRTDVNIPGIFHLTTRNYYPFYLGEKGLEKDNNWSLKLLESFNKEEVLVV